MQLNDATRIIDIIDQRIRKATASESRVETTWGKVAAVSADGRYADLYLYGESAPYASEYFRLPNGLEVNVGDSVKAAIDRERGDRWVEEVHTFSTYNKLAFDISDGEIRWGGGTGASDVKLWRPAAAKLQTDGDFYIGEAAQARFLYFMGAGSHIEFGDGAGAVDTNLYRHAANVLRTDDSLSVGAGLRVGTTTAPIGNEAIQFGSDVNLYRSGPNALATDDALIVAGELTAASDLNIGSGNARLRRTAAGRTIYDADGGSVWSEFAVTAISGQRAKFEVRLANDANSRAQLWGDATLAGLELGDGSALPDTNLYRSAANTLKSDDAFQAASLAIGTNKVARYVRLSSFLQAVPDASTTTTDITTPTATAEITGLPATGVVAVQVMVGGRQSAVAVGNVYAHDYDETTASSGNGVGAYTGHVAGFYTFNAGMVKTGGTNNRQIKYSVAVGSGTMTYYVRVIGYWTTE